MSDASETEKKVSDEPSVEGKTTRFRNDADIEAKKATANKSWQPSRQGDKIIHPQIYYLFG